MHRFSNRKMCLKMSTAKCQFLKYHFVLASLCKNWGMKNEGGMKSLTEPMLALWLVYHFHPLLLWIWYKIYNNHLKSAFSCYCMTIVVIWLQPHPSTCVLHGVDSFTVFLHNTNGRHMPAISAALLLSVVFEELQFPQITRAYNALHPTHNSVQVRSHHLYYNQPTIQLTTAAISHTGSPPTTMLGLRNSLPYWGVVFGPWCTPYQSLCGRQSGHLSSRGPVYWEPRRPPFVRQRWFIRIFVC